VDHSRPTQGLAAQPGWPFHRYPAPPQTPLDSRAARRAPGEGIFTAPPEPTTRAGRGWQRLAGVQWCHRESSERWGAVPLGCGPLGSPTVTFAFFTFWRTAPGAMAILDGWDCLPLVRPCLPGGLCAWQRPARSPYQVERSAIEPLQAVSMAMTDEALRPSWLAIETTSL